MKATKKNNSGTKVKVNKRIYDHLVSLLFDKAGDKGITKADIFNIADGLYDRNDIDNWSHANVSIALALSGIELQESFCDVTIGETRLFWNKPYVLLSNQFIAGTVTVISVEDQRKEAFHNAQSVGYDGWITCDILSDSQVYDYFTAHDEPQ